MDRSASAVWHGKIMDGTGTISTQSGTLKDTQYSFKTRFADGVGTNPEELIAAAHAGCFTMALSGELTKAGFTPDTLETTAVLTLDVHEAPTITKIHLTTKAKIPLIGSNARPNLPDISYLWTTSFMSADPGTAIAPSMLFLYL